MIILQFSAFRNIRGYWPCMTLGVLGVALTLAPAGAVGAQTLDEAVKRQLDVDSGGNTRCAVLLGGDVTQTDPVTGLNPVLTGPLRTTICDRNDADPVAPGTAAGGGAATPTILPRIVDKRLRKARGESDEGNGTGSDSVTQLWSGVNLFFSGEYESMDRDVTTFEDGYDSDIWRVAVGADYGFTDWLMAGLAFDYYRQDGDFSSQGAFETDSYGVLGFANLTPWAQSFVQVSVGWARKDHERNRFASFSEEFPQNSGEQRVLGAGFVDSEYDGDEYRLGLLTGYTFFVQNFRITPRAGLDWVRNSFDTYSESGQTGLELVFYGDDEIALQSTVGIQGSMSISTAMAVLVPQVSFDWKHEYKDHQRDLAVSFVGDTRDRQFFYNDEDPERNFYVVNAGISAVLPHGIQAFVNYRALVGHSFFEGHAGTIGMRIEF